MNHGTHSDPTDQGRQCTPNLSLLTACLVCDNPDTSFAWKVRRQASILVRTVPGLVLRQAPDVQRKGADLERPRKAVQRVAREDERLAWEILPCRERRRPRRRARRNARRRDVGGGTAGARRRRTRPTVCSWSSTKPTRRPWRAADCPQTCSARARSMVNLDVFVVAPTKHLYASEQAQSTAAAAYRGCAAGQDRVAPGGPEPDHPPMARSGADRR